MKIQMKEAIAITCMAIASGCSKNVFENETSLNLLHAKSSTSSVNAMQAIIQTSAPFFKAGFGAGTNLIRAVNGDTQIDDLTGKDLTNDDWVDTLERSSRSFTRFRFNYRTGTSVDRAVDIVDDPTGTPNNKCLRYSLTKATEVEEGTGFVKGRVQAELSNANTAADKAKEYYQKIDILFDRTGFNALKASSEPTGNSWLTIFEFWDEFGINNRQYRISVNVVNKTVNNVKGLYWEVGAQDFINGAYTDVPVGGLTRRTLSQISIGSWQTIEIYLKQSTGNNNDGKFQFAINGADPIVDYSGRTHGKNVTNPDGQEFWNPMKMYTRDLVLNVFKNAKVPMKIWWDNFEIRYKK
jgi:hypothetical protein